MKENEFQKKLIKELKKKLPGCVVLKNDSSYIQGIPDIIVLFRNRWAALECKRDKSAPLRPNQEWYIEKLNKMSFAEIVYPEVKDDILKRLVYYLMVKGK